MRQEPGTLVATGRLLGITIPGWTCCDKRRRFDGDTHPGMGRGTRVTSRHPRRQCSEASFTVLPPLLWISNLFVACCLLPVACRIDAVLPPWMHRIRFELGCTPAEALSHAPYSWVSASKLPFLWWCLMSVALAAMTCTPFVLGSVPAAPGPGPLHARLCHRACLLRLTPSDVCVAMRSPVEQH